MSWENYVSGVQTASACISLFLNFILILLIIKKSPEQLGSYRYLMIYTAFFEIFYSLVDVFVSPTIFSRGTMFFVLTSTKDSLFSKHTLLLTLCLWCACFGSFMVIFCIQFIYRYFVVIGSKSIKSFNDYRIVFWTSIPIVSGIAWGTMVYIYSIPKIQTDDVLKELLLAELDLVYEDITYVGPQFYSNIDDGGTSGIDRDALISVSYFLMVMITSLSCILYFAIKTFLEYRDTLTFSTSSNKLHRLHRQTFYALVTQTIIPVILLHCPCIILMTSAMMNIGLGHSSEIVSVAIAAFPAIDPLPVMLIIQNYRGTIISVISTPVNIFVRRQISFNNV